MIGWEAFKEVAMQLKSLCSMDPTYTGAVYLLRPYGNEAGLGFGVGTGSASGDRLRGTVQWSNHPTRRDDGAMLPSVRGVITTDDGAEVMFDATSRTVFVDRDGASVGRQLHMGLFESEDRANSWLNDTVCMIEGVIGAESLAIRFQIYECHSDLI